MDSKSLARYARIRTVEDEISTMRNGGVSRDLLLETQDSYRHVIQRFNNICATLGFDDPVQINTLFQFMLEKGFLSVDHEFNFAADNLKSVINKEFLFVDGANILAGKGVCRNCAVMLKDILLATDIPTFIILVKTAQNLTFKQHFIGNHVIVYCKSNGLSYFLEPTDAISYEPSNRRWTRFIFPESDKIIKMVKFKTCNELYSTKEEIAGAFESLGAKGPYMDSIDAFFITLLAVEICDSNIPLFEDFYQENKGDYKRVRDNLRKIKSQF